MFDPFGLILLGGIALSGLVVLLGLRIGSRGPYD